MKYVIRWRSKKREFITSAISNVSKDKLLIFRSKKELNKWYYELFEDKFKTKI